MSMKYSIDIQVDGKHLGEHEFEAEKSLIGRLKGDIPLQDEFCSQQHAVIFTAFDGKLWIRDLRSKNGIYVNQQRVELAPLKTGDVIRIGKTTLTISLKDVIKPHATLKVGLATYPRHYRDEG